MGARGKRPSSSSTCSCSSLNSCSKLTSFSVSSSSVPNLITISVSFWSNFASLKSSSSTSVP